MRFEFNFQIFNMLLLTESNPGKKAVKITIYCNQNIACEKVNVQKGSEFNPPIKQQSNLEYKLDGLFWINNIRYLNTGQLANYTRTTS